MPRVETRDAEQADAFFREARAAGHEGVMVKDLAARPTGAARAVALGTR